MKYKLINYTTKEETICDKVTIDGFDYYVSAVQATEGFYGYINFQGGDIKKIGKYFADDWKKVIATSNPNIDIPKVVDIFIIIEQWAKSKEKLVYQYWDKPSFIEGYNKSQETHSFTEQDVKNFAIFFEDYKEVLKAEGWEIIEAPIERVFEKWKEQQPKTVYYK